jgi:glycosyltransferase involved in cell wall biosynthesis
MLHPLAALPPRRELPSETAIVACIYDITPLEDAGRLDVQILKRGWARLAEADVVWASDEFKAALAGRYGSLAQQPVICYNAPPLGYLPDPTERRDGWLRAELRRQGADMDETDGLIILRAGAIGEHGGLEETLEALRDVPRNVAFLMMGRPSSSYKASLIKQISRFRLMKRAFLWDRPSDDEWKRALLGADVGHLIHGPFPKGRLARLYDCNSSLSNNRLYQYLAAGLPIISYDDTRLSRLHEEIPAFRVVRLSNLREDLVACITELVISPERRAVMGFAARQAHRRRYHWEYQFRSVIDRISERLTGGSGHGRHVGRGCLITNAETPLDGRRTDDANQGQ